MNKQQTIELLQKQLPSFYSVEQVIAIISDIKEGDTRLEKEHIEELIKVVGDRVGEVMDNADNDDVVDLSSAEFDISYDNKLELSSVDLDLGGLCDKVRDAIENSITDYLGGI